MTEATSTPLPPRQQAAFEASAPRRRLDLTHLRHAPRVGIVLAELDALPAGTILALETVHEPRTLTILLADRGVLHRTIIAGRRRIVTEYGRVLTEDA